MQNPGSDAGVFVSAEAIVAKRNPRYDNLYVFKPDLSKLRPGDIILTRNVEGDSLKGRAQSAAIARATNGHFSHALFCTIPPTLMEAIGEGVSNVTAQICFVHDLANIRILRYRDPSIARKAAAAAAVFLGKGYSVRKAIRSIAPGATEPSPDSDQTFCSALVASALRAADAPEFTALNPFKITPAFLEKADCFLDVTQDVFIKILSPNNIEEMSALDGERIASPLAPQASLFNGYYLKLSPLIRDFAKKYTALPPEKLPASFLDCLSFVDVTYSALEMGPLSQEGSLAYKHLQSVDDAAYAMLASGEIMKMLEAADEFENENNQYSLSESFKQHPDISRNDTFGLISATKQQIDVRSSILGRRSKSIAWTEWQRITQFTVDVLTRRLQVLEEIRTRVFFDGIEHDKD